ncbi:N-acetylglucosamine-6-phosphate deacetylase [Arthrobacter sp. JSM 101049]|uniref:N-acetylglucosamine-6-phosphate deacetylase n=1 Tax=Arthrobacter sp. JSM 101049 TaxID=929097 RepID=UPI00356450D4
MTSTEEPTRLYLSGRAVTSGTTIDEAVLAFEGDRIAFIGTQDEFAAWPDAGAYSEVRIPNGATLLPGLVDVHCHGAAGADFPSADGEAAERAIRYLHASGTTTLLASLVTADRQEMLRAAEVLAPLAERELLAGIHAEGPFLSSARCGAQDPAFLTSPDPDFVDELVASARGQLRTMTYAPELAGSDALVEQLVSHGVLPSVGHTDADAETVTASIEVAVEELSSAGFDGYTERATVTHLFNGMPPLHHRSPGPVAACLQAAAQGQAVLEIIADGVHVDPATVRMLFALLGPEAIVLVTDSMAATGLADGEYALGPQQVVVSDGAARLADGGSLAGGIATLLDVVRHTVESGVPLEQAVLSATSVPAELVGLADEVGALRVGFSADALVVDRHLRLVSVFRDGLQLEAIPA